LSRGEGTSAARSELEDLVRNCLRLDLRDAVDLLELLEELGLGRVARLLPRAESVERDLVRVRVRVCGSDFLDPIQYFLWFEANVGLKKVASGTVVAILKSRQLPHTARLTTAPSRAFSLGRYSSTRSAISTRAAELALPADVHIMWMYVSCAYYHLRMQAWVHVAVHRPIRSGWPRRAAALGRSWRCWALCASPFTPPRHGCFTGSIAATVVLPLAAPLARNVLELHLAAGHCARHRHVCLHRAQLHRATGMKAHGVLSAIIAGDATRVETAERMGESV
jgi:hypothetical protein